MLDEIPLLRVLTQAGEVVVAEIRKAANPVVLLNDNAMSQLLLTLREVHEELAKSPVAPDSAVAKLIAELDRIVAHYRDCRNAYFGGANAAVHRANDQREALREIERIEAMLKNLGDNH